MNTVMKMEKRMITSNHPLSEYYMTAHRAELTPEQKLMRETMIALAGILFKSGLEQHVTQSDFYNAANTLLCDVVERKMQHDTVWGAMKNNNA